MIENYLTTNSTWQRTTGHDDYGQPLTTASTIPTRWEQRRKLLTNAQGQQVVSVARVFTIAAVAETDFLVDATGRPWPVIEVFVVSRLDGSEDHRECYL